MSKEQQYREMLDEMPIGDVLANYSTAQALESVDETAYRCGMNDFQATCERCGDETWNDDGEDGAVYCEDCLGKRCTSCGEFACKWDDWSERTPVLCDDCGGVDPVEPEETDDVE
jgi:hypothetical protein